MAQTETREPGTHTVTVTVNGKRSSREVEPRQLLVYFIREQLGLIVIVRAAHIVIDFLQADDVRILSFDHLDDPFQPIAPVPAAESNGNGQLFGYGVHLAAGLGSTVGIVKPLGVFQISKYPST